MEYEICAEWCIRATNDKSDTVKREGAATGERIKGAAIQT